ncbi:biotin/lipoyl-binding protein [Methylonatrum kenyense]|uniref:efflux RND transporter periplasmic adaptor subunit n=1 Tax=Methylonatrum kenyense TaxID=455253 RepID=UPI0020BE0EAD|nr:HlyD family efflux transporter periplasmic adaptor subunit [Methylonatrum kenyense]MCK8515773.1 biotin/lipoyl-binding protein [Methylonatrum kenyense]
MRRLRTVLRLFFPFVILGLAAALTALLWVTRTEVPAEPAEERAWPVSITTVAVSANRPVLRLQGFVESPRVATLTSAVTADVAAVPAREGDQVVSGQGLVRLDHRELRLTLDEREADLAELRAQREVEERRIGVDREEVGREQELLELLEREVARLRDLSREQFASPSDLERAEQERTRQRQALAERRFAVDTAAQRLEQLDARLERARALRDRSALDLARIEVKAPFDGRVAELLVSPGDRVTAGEPLVRLYDLDALEIRSTVPSQALAALRLALASDQVQARGEVDGQPLTLVLSRFSGQSTRGQGGVDALFQVTTGAEELVIGRFASLEVVLPAEPDSVVLPFEALYDAGRIYRVVDDRMQAIDVQRLGQAYQLNGERGVLVRAEGLQSGDQVVSTQIPQAMNGLRVQVIER